MKNTLLAATSALGLGALSCLAAPVIAAAQTAPGAAPGPTVSAAGPITPAQAAITVTAAWMRQPPPGASVAGGFMTIANAGEETDRLLGGEAPFAGRVEIHAMAMADGMMRMHPVAGGLAIAPGGTVALEPGGYHVMFMDLTDWPQAGQSVTMTLDFERTGTVTVPMTVAPIGAQSPGDGHGYGMESAR